ncbi:hypothetical protein [Parasitella parasitica]|uniref:Uncharacterized protein n=1 Tax=Parasitella parasitica TaxID=35722 RepID=A0A0B7MVX7_9FUNG|nr:hypothetical protein [Parasitella parasitica]
MHYTLLYAGILVTMTFTAFADISDFFEDTLGESNAGVLDAVVSKQFAESVVRTIPASTSQRQPASDSQVISADYYRAVPANYPQVVPPNYPQAAPANFPQAIPTYYRPSTDDLVPSSFSPNIQYTPYRVSESTIGKVKESNDVKEKEEEEDEEEEDEEEEDEEEFDADDLVTRRRRR